MLQDQIKKRQEELQGRDAELASLKTTVEGQQHEICELKDVRTRREMERAAYDELLMKEDVR